MASTETIDIKPGDFRGAYRLFVDASWSGRNHAPELIGLGAVLRSPGGAVETSMSRTLFASGRRAELEALLFGLSIAPAGAAVLAFTDSAEVVSRLRPGKASFRRWHREVWAAAASLACLRVVHLKRCRLAAAHILAKAASSAARAEGVERGNAGAS